MLDIASFIMIVWALVTLYFANIKRGNHLFDYGGTPPPSRERVMVWLHREILLGCALTLAIVIDEVVRVLVRSVIFTAFGWAIVVIYICQYLWIRREMKRMTEHDNDWQ